MSAKPLLTNYFMEKMNSLIKYTDWLLLTREQIEPRVGDKIKYLTDDYTFIDEEIRYINKVELNRFLYLYKDDSSPVNYKDCYVEILYTSIKWKELDHEIIGYLNDFPMFRIVDISSSKFPNSDYNLFGCLQYEAIVINGTSSVGSLEDCKTFANKLLYGTS